MKRFFKPLRSYRWRRRGRLAVVVLLLGSVRLCVALDPPVSRTCEDRPYDVVFRPTDAGASTPFDPTAHRLIEMLNIELGRWVPDEPALDLFAGVFAQGGNFVRMDLRVAGLVNPPGRNEVADFEPFRYGPHPVYGFVEIDMDDSNDTGGEIDAPEYRYLGNIARFGGLPEGDAFEDRVAREASDLDDNFLTEPYVERHGEEFHLALLGGQFEDIDILETAGDGDLLFEAGEAWTIRGRWFHRAHGFEPFSVAAGGAVPGEYAPMCSLRFAHDVSADRTVISLVFPLTNGAAAAQYGEPPQPMNHDPSDHASVNEAMRDLVISAGVVDMYPTGMPEEALILGWKDQASGQHLDPSGWRLTALLGTAYTSPGPAFVWTDAMPDPVRGNVNGEYGANADDIQEIDEYIEYHDHEDGTVDGRAELAGFAENFCVMDVNHDGVVDARDVMLVSPVGDWNGDGDVDLADFSLWQRCAALPGVSEPCSPADLDTDGDVDASDVNWFVNVLTGPQGP